MQEVPGLLGTMDQNHAVEKIQLRLDWSPTKANKPSDYITVHYKLEDLVLRCVDYQELHQPRLETCHLNTQHKPTNNACNTLSISSAIRTINHQQNLQAQLKPHIVKQPGEAPTFRVGYWMLAACSIVSPPEGSTLSGDPVWPHDGNLGW